MTDGVWAVIREDIETVINGHSKKVEREFGAGERVTIYRMGGEMIRVDVKLTQTTVGVTPDASTD